MILKKSRMLQPKAPKGQRCQTAVFKDNEEETLAELLIFANCKIFTTLVYCWPNGVSLCLSLFTALKSTP